MPLSRQLCQGSSTPQSPPPVTPFSPSRAECLLQVEPPSTPSHREMAFQLAQPLLHPRPLTSSSSFSSSSSSPSRHSVTRRPRARARASQEHDPCPRHAHSSAPADQVTTTPVPPAPAARHAPVKTRRAFIIAAAATAAVTLSPGLQPVNPPSADALSLAPTPINPYARRRSERAYKEYAQKLEERVESSQLADFRKVVEAGGGGLGVGYRIAGFAAFVASALSTAVVHPLDSIKTRMQAKGTAEEVEGGLFDNLYTGLWSNVLKEAPNAAIYLGVYELIKATLMNLSVTSFFHDVPLVTFMVAGALGDAIGSLVRVPAEIVNKRLQLGVNSDWKAALADAFFSSAGREGSLVAWKAVLLRDVPYGGLQIMAYEFGKVLLANHTEWFGGYFAHAGIMLDVFVGALAGAMAAMATTPADVLVTRLSVQNPQSYLETHKYMGVASTARRILEDEGVGGFFKGTLQRGLYYAPMIGLFFALYETNRRWLSDPQACMAALEPLRSLVMAEWHALPAQYAAFYSVAMPLLSGLLSVLYEQLPFAIGLGHSRG